ncbi:MAG: hypothetical protein CL912_16360 [Deltaproteobacteria bacterium]|nr:hypothetical protein [Deltaproteobacteria bacterium]
MLLRDGIRVSFDLSLQTESPTNDATVLLLTKWVHAKETLQHRGITLDEADTKIIQRVRDMLAEDIETNDVETSLAATLTRSWADFYDDTWIWGVTPKLGRILRQLAKHYESKAM